MKILLAYLVICSVLIDLFIIAILRNQPRSWYEQVPLTIRRRFYIGAVIVNVLMLILASYVKR